MNKTSGAETIEKIGVSPFGLLSAMVSTVVCLPYTVIILAFYFLLPEFFEKAKWALVILSSMSKVKASAVFWLRFFPNELDSHNDNLDWRSSVKRIVFSNSISIRGVIEFFVDVSIDFVLIYLAFKASASPISIISVFLVCQFIANLIHGLALCYKVNPLSFRKISLLVSAIAFYAALEVNSSAPPLFGSLFHLNHLAKANQILCILGVKCFVSGIYTITHDSIAKMILITTSNKFKNSKISPCQ